MERDLVDSITQNSSHFVRYEDFVQALRADIKYVFCALPTNKHLRLCLLMSFSLTMALFVRVAGWTACWTT